ncbi:hypothetical protein AVEN_267568-1 [Araneus ventricosus]|uniref:Uncharacterized protein n=1 Tax=Araneus ventricosus TaxID=182803 RepID=A0A4Y2TJK2_ARAVE|nr:hypothetical protein AVEN_267568-1 [Araneus ventricosus]
MPNIHIKRCPISSDNVFVIEHRIHYCYKAKAPHDQYLFTGVEEIRRLREEQACDNRQNAVVTGKMLLYQEPSQVLEHMAVVGSQIGKIGGMVKRLSATPEVLQQVVVRAAPHESECCCRATQCQHDASHVSCSDPTTICAST